MDVTHNKSKPWCGLFLTLCFTAALAGCVTTDVHAPPWSFFDGPSHGPVGQLVTMWAEGIVEQPDRQTGALMPGFSGRVYLFSINQTAPLGADGAMRVCLFDCNDPRGASAPALEIWELRDVDIKQMLKKDGVGWGYNLWLPWSTYRPDISRVAIRMQYVPKIGMPIWSGTSEIAIGQAPPTVKTTSQTVTPRGNGAAMNRPAVR